MAKTNGEIKEETNVSSAISRKRERYIEAMQPLLKKHVVRYVGNDKHINIKFNRRGIEHIADDILNKKIRISKRELSKLDDFLRDAIYIKSSGLYKDRKDGITKFYYFKDKNKDLYYNVAERIKKEKDGRIDISRFLYSATNNIK